MSMNAANGRTIVFADIEGRSAVGSAGLSPITHTMSGLSPLTHTMLDPVFGTLPTPDIGTLPAPIVGPQPEPGNEASVIETDGEYEAEQWHFDFLGDIEKIWEEYSGAGVHVGVYDDSVEADHPDLVGNYDLGSEVIVDGQPVHALTPAEMGYRHGTAVAGLIGASRNEFGTTGVAWGAFITGVPILWAGGPVDINSNEAGFLAAVDQSENFDVINHSWGRYAGFWQAENVPGDAALVAEWMEALEDGRVKELDGGEEIRLGTIQVKAAGNDNLNTNGDGPATTRATIVVGAYDDDGDASYYSNFGSNLLVSSPSNGDSSNRGLVTTDVTSFPGYNIVNSDQDFELDYTNEFGGTSGATPIVSGVVALMLEANPYLGWRDVQNILAYSAREIGSGVGGERTDTESFDWRYNGAGNWNGGGLHYSEDYGYGSVDAYNAVRMAEVWELFAAPQASANETSYSSTATDVVLQDLKNNDILFTFDGSSFDVESVSVTLTITHEGESVFLELFNLVQPLAYPAFLTDLQIYLISPSGTVTDLADFATRDALVDNVGGENGLDLSFNANAFRGEDGIGTWTLRIVDAQAEDAGIVNSATVTLHGRNGDAAGQNLSDDVYHYTNEVFATLARDASRQTLTDGNGGTDWLNLAAMSGNPVVNLGQGATSTAVALAFLTIAAGTDIENAVTGDGNDSLTGNDLANRLHGMRGNDTIDGGAGDDTLSGGAGNDTLTGGIGLDFFLFDRALNSLTNVDIITDFGHADDAIWLDATIFAGLSVGTLDASAFYIGATAQDELDRIIYDSLTGALFFDVDGSGEQAAYQFATLLGSPDDLTFDDFVVFDESVAPLTPAEDRVATAPPTYVATDVEDVQGDGSPYFGTDGVDRVRGKSANDEFFLGGGDDTAHAGDGNDFIDGGQGIDFLMGAGGDDIIYGGGSPEWLGDYIYGGEGNDIIYGSNQANDSQIATLAFHADLLSGQEGDDIIYGFDGDDWLYGAAGNDILYAGDGSDFVVGHEGDDRMVMGNGERAEVDGGEGSDTAVFEGNFADHKFFVNPWEHWLVFLERLDESAENYAYTTGIHWETVEFLEFADVTMDIGSRPLWKTIFDTPEGSLTLDGWEIGVELYRVGKFDLVDEGAVDRLTAVHVLNWNFSFDNMTVSDITIKSDALTLLEVGGFKGSVTVEAAAGERELLFYSFVSNRLRPEDVISDNTATSIRYNSQGQFEYLMDDYAVAGVNDYNLSFASAETFTVWEGERDTRIAWFAPEMTTIDLRTTVNHRGTQIGGGSYWRITFETPLDDAVLMTAGGSEEFRYFGNDKVVANSPGSDASQADFIRFGNLGEVNTSNDGTLGEEAGTNAGLGLRGIINLGAGTDEARILGSDAFQGGTLDGGTGVSIDNYSPESDTIRMTFGVAAAIADISEHIVNFEVLRLDAPTLTGQVVDITKFDTLNRIVITGTTASGGDNTVTNIVEDSTVTIASGTRQEEWAYTYDQYGNQFGTIHLDMTGDGDDDTLNLEFKGYAIDSYSDGARPIGLDEGTIHVLDAEIVHITTEEFDNGTWIFDVWMQPFDVLSGEPLDPFTQVLDLDVTTTVTLAGETGWDFTVAGTDIGKLTLLDASGVTGFGAVGAVKAMAQTGDDVTFKGGFGDDELTGGAGDDTLDGGGYGNDLLDGGTGSDTAVFAGDWADYAITIADGVVTLANLSDGTTDTVKGTELFEFADRRVSASNLLTGEGAAAPTDIALSNASIAELSDDGTVVGTLSATDPDGAPGQAFTYELIDDAGGRFALLGDKLVVADGAAIDYEMAASHAVTVKVTDSDGLSFEKTLTIAVGDVNDKAAVSLANATAAIAENTSTASRIKVADIVVADDAIGSNRLSLTGRDAKFFEIVGMALFLKAGVLLDFEQRQSLEVAVAVDDDAIAGSPDATSPTYVLAISDVADQNVITGTPGNNTLTGTSGDDFFDGKGGRDTFKGGRGNDVYVVDSSDDKVIEVSGQGTDTVLSSATKYTLASNVNNLTLTGTGDIDGTGNASSNVILGNAGNNKLSGGAGNDTIDGGAGDDYMDGGTGTDTLSYASAEDGITISLALKGAQNTSGAGIDTIKGFQNLIGSGYADTLAGDGGKNVLDGGADADAMSGGKGDDTYIVDNSGDAVHELAKQGTDTVKSSAASFTLGANVENATLIGNGVEAVGNALANKLTGNAIANILTGGAGKDVFVFNAALGAGNVDAITDFSAADDTIHIDNAAFASVGRNGGLSYFAFTTGAEAHDRNDRIIYDDDTGALYYDADGSGHRDQVLFATLDANLNLTYKDFYVV